tara:strand:- start:209 stop:442 length:234 start_codon:yes stop_codon:yes gene_type:complete
MSARIHSREDLQYTIKELIADIDRSKAAVNRKRKLPTSAKVFSLVDLDNKRAVLQWAERMATAAPEGIQITENGEEI